MATRFANCIGNLCKSVLFAYGSRESLPCSGITIENAEDFKDHLIGQPSPGIEMKIVNEKEVVPVNTRGEIFVKTKAVFEGYYNDPDATKACLTENGWVRMDNIFDEDVELDCIGS